MFQLADPWELLSPLCVCPAVLPVMLLADGLSVVSCTPNGYGTVTQLCEPWLDSATLLRCTWQYIHQAWLGALQVLLDEMVLPAERIVNYNTAYSGQPCPMLVLTQAAFTMLLVG